MKALIYIYTTLAACLLFVSSCKQELTGITILENGHFFNGKEMVQFRELALHSDTILYISNEQTTLKGERIQLDGRYVLPGLVDAHVHLSGAPTQPYTRVPPQSNAHSSLLCGVTTVIDLFYAESGCKKFKKETDAQPSEYTSVLLSGPILTALGGHGTEYGVPTRTITSVKEARRITQEVIDTGVDVIKLVYEAYSGKNALDKDMLNAIVTVAHSNNIKVFAHINLASEAMDCIDAAVDVLAHLPWDIYNAEQLKRLKESGIITIPTVSVMKSYYEGHSGSFMSDPLLWSTADNKYLEKFNRDSALKAPYRNERLINNTRSNLRNLIRAQIPIVAGTDAGNYAVFYGYSLHDELYEYVNAGMTPVAAINTATGNLDMIFKDWRKGHIKKGYTADLLILNKNPLEQISHTKDIYKIFHRGLDVKN